MIISKTSQYAIQTLIYLATQPSGTPVLNSTAAKHLGVPAPYLAKVMQDLSKGGVVNSYRGRTGGSCLRVAPEEISLMRILQITEGPEFTKDCVLGLKACSDETACPMHRRWVPIKTEIIEMLNTLTLDLLSQAVLSGKYRICDILDSINQSR
jgi:Rrf2 family protein